MAKTPASGAAAGPSTIGPRGQQGPDAGPDSGGEGVKGRWLVLVIILTAIFMQLLDTTITTVAVPSIQNKLGASSAEIQFVLAGYSLAFGDRRPAR
jgi:hypothetical protein